MATVYDIVTEKIVKELEKGTIPWRKPWIDVRSTINGEAVLQQNLFTRKPYRGINSLLTMLSPFNSPFWVSQGELRKRGIVIKRGEEKNYTPIIYFNWRSKEEIRKANEAGDPKAPCFAKFFKAWNAEQLDNVDQFIPELDKLDIKNNFPLEQAEEIVSKYKDCPSIRAGGDKASYSPLTDLVSMPFIETFNSPEDYHGTLFHELVHSTGHTGRLNRESVANLATFGSELYSKEELIAEIGSCFLCATAGISSPKLLENSAAYIDGWLGKLKKDSRLVMSAAQQAQKAVDYILQVELQKFD